MLNLPNMKAPCSQCPFRKDIVKGWLGKARTVEITQQSTFVCHKNTGKQCAGHMLMLEDNNDFVRLAARLNIPTNLSGKELVFDDPIQFVEHHTFDNHRGNG